jgi:hypothetical protein
MKTLIGITLISIIYFGTARCDECIGTGFGDCSDLFSFRVVDKVNHQDLVFGQNHLYNPDSVHLFANLPGYSETVSLADSTEFMSTLPTPLDTFFLYLNSVDTDTLLMKYDFKKEPCCRMKPGYGKITEIKFNGAVAEKQGDTFLLPK